MQHVTYAKLPIYMRQYIKVKYGGEPIRFPGPHPVNGVLDLYTTRNAEMKALTPNSCCEIVYNLQHSIDATDVQAEQPSEDDKREFIQLALPEYVMKYSSPREVDGFWQLTAVGFFRFRALMKNEFWNGAFAFITDCFSRAHARGELTTRENAMSDFMMMYDIPMDQFETMMRYERRESKRFEAAIEQNRSMLQRETGNRFFYT